MAQDAQSEALGVMEAPAADTGRHSAEKASSTENPEVLAERCDFLYRRITPAIVATIGLSLLLDAFLWRTRPIPLLVFWQTTVLVLATGFWLLGWFYRREKAKGAIDPKVWVRRAAIGALALGTGWGYAAAVFFPGGEQEQIFIAFVVALVATGGLPMFSTVWWVYALYAAGAMMPFNVVLFAYGTENFRVLGGAVPMLYVANVFTAYQLGRVFAAAYGLRGAYRKLWDDNAEINAQLASQLDDLLEAHRAASDGDRDRLHAVGELARAFAPSAELFLETTAQGRAFAEVTLAVGPSTMLKALAEASDPPPLPVAAGCAAAEARAPAQAAGLAYAHAFAANLVSACLRLAPVGQTDGQRVLARLEPVAAGAVERAARTAPDDLAMSTLAVDIGSMRHETQHTRLFRS